MKDGAPSEDGVRMKCRALADQEIQWEVAKMVQFMFVNDPQKWGKSLKVGHIIPIYKKGDWNVRINCRGVLLAMGRRILVRAVSEAQSYGRKPGGFQGKKVHC